MKISTLLIAIIFCFINSAFGQEGSLDPTFSFDGVDTADFNGQNDFVYPALTQPDNKIIVAGYTFSSTSYDFAILRYNQDGSPDTTFSGDGKSTIDWSGGDDFVNSLALQPDGKILIGGSATVGGNTEIALIRLTPDGIPDSTFSNDGMFTIQVGSFGAPFAILIQPDGKIILAGFSFNAGNDFTLIRCLSNGDLDNTFGSNGIVVTSIISGDDIGTSAVLQPDGKIVMTGYLFNGADVDIALARYNNDGTLDTSFNGIGYTITDLSNTDNYGYAVRLLPDEKIVVGGYTYSTSSDFLLLQYNSNGSIDSSFNTDGKVITDISNSDDFAISMTVQPDNRIVLGGYTDTGTDIDFAVARYNPDGSLDSTFDADGKVTTDLDNTENFGTIITQGDNRLTLVGYTLGPSGHDFETVSYTCDACEAAGNLATVILESTNDNTSVVLYPNPVNDKAIFKYTTDHDLVSLELYDAAGRMVRSFINNEMKDQGPHVEELNLSQFPEGIYFLVFTSEGVFKAIELARQD